MVLHVQTPVQLNHLLPLSMIRLILDVHIIQKGCRRVIRLPLITKYLAPHLDIAKMDSILSKIAPPDNILTVVPVSLSINNIGRCSRSETFFNWRFRSLLPYWWNSLWYPMFEPMQTSSSNVCEFSNRSLSKSGITRWRQLYWFWLLLGRRLYQWIMYTRTLFWCRNP